MSDPIRFTVPIEPRGKGRPRASVRGGRVHTYTDQKTRDYESAVASAAQAQASGRFLMGPVAVFIRAIFSRPKRLEFVSKRTGEARYPRGLLWAPEARVDADNVAKAVLDGCKALWRDDRQVVRLTVEKKYCELQGLGRLEVVIEEVEANGLD